LLITSKQKAIGVYESTNVSRRKTMLAILDRFNNWFLVSSFGSGNRSGIEIQEKEMADKEYRRRVLISGTF
jgi:hypothetical protein